jgi:hypothetical protein
MSGDAEPFIKQIEALFAEFLADKELKASGRTSSSSTLRLGKKTTAS